MATAVHRELTPKEKSRPYAKYYDRPMTPAPREIYDFLDRGPIDPALALPIEKRNDLLRPGYLPAERGYCVLPDGSGFVAGLTTMPGVTPEMIDWWFAWHGLEGLRYGIWDPEDHLNIHVAPETLERRLSPALSLRERNWSTTDVVTEDVGTGSIVLEISFLSPQDFGYDMELFAKGAATAVSSNTVLQATRSGLVAFTHVARVIPGGIELRSRFWIGWNIVDRKAVRVGREVPAEAIAGITKGLAYHCPKEYYNLAAILPRVYAENSGIADRLEEFRKA
jgi:hypothetical protein